MVTLVNTMETEYPASDDVINIASNRLCGPIMRQDINATMKSLWIITIMTNQKHTFNTFDIKMRLSPTLSFTALNWDWLLSLNITAAFETLEMIILFQENYIDIFFYIWYTVMKSAFHQIWTTDLLKFISVLLECLRNRSLS